MILGRKGRVDGPVGARGRFDTSVIETLILKLLVPRTDHRLGSEPGIAQTSFGRRIVTLLCRRNFPSSLGVSFRRIVPMRSNKSISPIHHRGSSIGRHSKGSGIFRGRRETQASKIRAPTVSENVHCCCCRRCGYLAHLASPSALNLIASADPWHEDSRLKRDQMQTIAGLGHYF